MKKEKREWTGSDKIGRARRLRNRRFVGMYVVGVLAGASWAYTIIEGSRVVGDMMTPRVYASSKGAEVVESAEHDQEWKEAVVTAYTAGDGYTPGTVMASGRTVYVGAVACPRDIPLGTVVEIEGVGIRMCEDRKALRFDGEFDIYMSDYSDAVSFGRGMKKWRVIGE